MVMAWGCDAPHAKHTSECSEYRNARFQNPRSALQPRQSNALTCNPRSICYGKNHIATGPICGEKTGLAETAS